MKIDDSYFSFFSSNSEVSNTFASVLKADEITSSRKNWSFMDEVKDRKMIKLTVFSLSNKYQVHTRYAK